MMTKKLIALGLAAVTALAPVASVSAEEAATEATTEATTEAATEAAAEAADGAVEIAEGADVAARSSEAAPEWQEYNNLIAQIKVETDTVKREELMHQAEDILMGTSALVPLYYYNDIYMQKEAVTGIYSNNYGFKYFMFADNGDNTTLKLCLSSEPNKLDPALNSTVDGACLAVSSFTGLATYNEAGEVELALADSYEVSEDGLVYTFTMKDGLMWSDGSELTAKDFEYSWKRAAAPETAADYSYMFDAIATNEDGSLNVVASEDGKTLTVTLKAPCVYFMDLCAFPAYYPVQQASVEAAEGWEENPGLWAQEAGFVSNGAYKLVEWKHNESMVYEKNPNWYRADEVKIERLEFMLSSDATAMFAAYNAGDLDFIDDVPTDEIENLLENPEFHIVDQLGTYYMCFNVNSDLFAGKTPEEASKMRRAFSLLIDRDYIAENIGQTGQVPANTFIPAGMMDGNGGEFRANDDAYTYPNADALGYFDPSYDAYDANLEEAIALLEEVGYVFDEDGTLSDETPISVTYLTNEGSGNVAIAEALQADMAVIGIDLTIETAEWSVFLDERKAGNFDLARNGWVADFNDPINMLEMWTTESGNNDAQFGR